MQDAGGLSFSPSRITPRQAGSRNPAMVPDLRSQGRRYAVRSPPSPAPLAGIGVVISGAPGRPMGIHSGGTDGGGDYYGGLPDPCVEVDTDIYDAYYGFPGYLKTG